MAKGTRHKKYCTDPFSAHPHSLDMVSKDSLATTRQRVGQAKKICPRPIDKSLSMRVRRTPCSSFRPRSFAHKPQFRLRWMSSTFNLSLLPILFHGSLSISITRLVLGKWILQGLWITFSIDSINDYSKERIDDWGRLDKASIDESNKGLELSINWIGEEKNPM